MFNQNKESIIKNEAVDAALKKYTEVLGERTVDFEEINIEDSLSRILYDDILVQYDIPAYNKSLVDGYAVSSKNISLADPDNPIPLKIAAEAIVENPQQLKIGKGDAIKISTGAMLPENADSVVLAEDTLTESSIVKILKSTVMGENIAKKGEDATTGDMFIRKNRKLRPQDIGGIIGLGYRKVRVYKKPVISIIPTGSELVPIDTIPEPGQLISSNGYVLKSTIEQLGCIGRLQPIVKDNLELVRNAIMESLPESDVVIISGGSSIGEKDYTLKAIQSIPESKIICHGIAMRPGKLTLLAYIGGKPVIGLPGHPVSSLTSFLVFVKPVIVQLAGNPRSFWQERKDNVKIDAILSKNVESPKGREDYVRVRLKLLDNGKITAYPYAGKSSFLSTLVKAHGIIKLAPDCVKLFEGDRVQVILF